MIYSDSLLVSMSFLQGFAEDSNVVYKLMIKVYGLMNLSLDKQLNLLWKNGRLSHPICASLSLTFIQDISNEFRTYKDHFGKEFLHDFSFLFAHSHPSPNPRISCEMTSKVSSFCDKIYHFFDTIYHTYNQVRSL